MPFVDAKITCPVTAADKDALKSALGKAISDFGKGESWLMVGIDDNYSLYLGGRELDHGAYVSVSMVGDTPDAACAQFSSDVCDILGKILDIPADSIYVTFHPMKPTRWGWNGSTF